VNAKRIASKETFEYSPATALALGGLVLVLGVAILFLVLRLMAGV
jgi:hypothetical protein